MSGEYKVVCSNRHCEWCGQYAQALKAPDPFNEGCELSACPNCRDQSLVVACDEPGCVKEATCGTPTLTGYRVTCGHHQPQTQTLQSDANPARAEPTK